MLVIVLKRSWPAGMEQIKISIEYVRYNFEWGNRTCVPDLQFDPLSVDHNSANFEINTDCRYIIARECVVRKSDKQR